MGSTKLGRSLEQSGVVKLLGVLVSTKIIPVMNLLPTCSGVAVIVNASTKLHFME